MIFKRLAIVTALAMLPCSCASVTVSLPSMSAEAERPAPAKERVALAAAAQRLDAALPPAPTQKEQIGRLLFGGRGKADVAAARSYLSAIDASGARAVSFVLADVDEALQHARGVAEAGRLASSSLAPSLDDVVLLEAAISDVRRCRTLYAEALQLLHDDGAPLTRDDIREVKHAFAQTLADIGTAADSVAARLRVPPPSQVAAPATGGAMSGY